MCETSEICMKSVKSFISLKMLSIAFSPQCGANFTILAFLQNCCFSYFWTYCGFALVYGYFGLESGHRIRRCWAIVCCRILWVFWIWYECCQRFAGQLNVRSLSLGQVKKILNVCRSSRSSLGTTKNKENIKMKKAGKILRSAVPATFCGTGSRYLGPLLGLTCSISTVRINLRELVS